MAWTAPSTVTTNQIVTAALWNQQVRDNLLALSTHAHTGAAGDGNDEMTGLDFLNFDDLAASPATSGRAQRNGANLEYYNGSAVVKVTEADAASGASPRSLGTGATQAAAGNHTHALNEDAAAGTAGGTRSSVTVTIANASVNNGATLDTDASPTLTKAGRLVGVVHLRERSVVGGSDTLDLIIDGVTVSTQTGGTVMVQRGSREVASGARTVRGRFTNNQGAPITVYVPLTDAVAITL